jgi:predicted HTH domain antitoxin
MHTVTIEIQDEFDKKAVLLSVAKQLYDRGILSKRQGADLAEVPMNDFLLAVLHEGDPLREILRPTQENNSAEEWTENLKTRENYKGLKKKELNRLIEELDIQEPLDLLLSQLTR